MRGCPEAVCADCGKGYRPWGDSNLCLRCYEKTVAPEIRTKEFVSAKEEAELYGGKL